MDQKHFVLRDAEEKDYDFILRVNEENVEVLSPMPLERLKLFKEHANVLQVAEIDGELAAFIICMREGDDWYDSENYLWFCKTYPKFLYVDRIVLDEPFRHRGLGRYMYEAVFAKAKADGVPVVTCEVDTVPYNGPSLLFHDIMGFKEVGAQYVRGGTVKVSLQAVEIK